MKINVEKMTGKQAKELLELIIEKLDELDEDDFFWYRRMGTFFRNR
jgi:hypothetical protein